MASPAGPAAATEPSALNGNNTPTKSQPPATLDTLVASGNANSSSLADDGSSTRPRDARLIHNILHTQGVTAYEDRVPLMLLDFAYRHTRGVLQDALHASAETSTQTGSGRGGGAGAGSDMNVSQAAVRQAIASRLTHAFRPSLPKEHYLEEAARMNRVALPKVERGFGIRLPPERYVLSGVGWNLREEWDSDGEDESEDETQMQGVQGAAAPAQMDGAGDVVMKEEENDGDDQFEEVMGGSDSTAGGNA